MADDNHLPIHPPAAWGVDSLYSQVRICVFHVIFLSLKWRNYFISHFPEGTSEAQRGAVAHTGSDASPVALQWPSVYGSSHRTPSPQLWGEEN